MKKFLFIVLILSQFYCKKYEEVFDFKILAGASSGSGIKYTALEPDDSVVFVHPSTFITRYIDINDDGAEDFGITVNASVTVSNQDFLFTITPFIKNAEVAVMKNHLNLVDTLPLNTVIDSRLNWNKGSLTLSQYTFAMPAISISSGYWNNCKNKFVGVRMYNKTDTVYGWISMEIVNNSKLYIKEFACKLTE